MTNIMFDVEMDSVKNLLAEAAEIFAEIGNEFEYTIAEKLEDRSKWDGDAHRICLDAHAATAKYLCLNMKINENISCAVGGLCCGAKSI